MVLNTSSNGIKVVRVYFLIHRLLREISGTNIYKLVFNLN